MLPAKTNRRRRSAVTKPPRFAGDKLTKAHCIKISMTSVACEYFIEIDTTQAG